MYSLTLFNKMKKLFVFAAVICAVVLSTLAGVPITKVDKIAPTDEIFMDMATTAASKSIQSKGLPCGAVIILNGAWIATGTPTANATAEQNAIAKSGRTSLANASIYTINEPTTEAYNDICRFGADAVYFVNPREVVIAKGIYPASAYDDSKIDSTLTQVPLRQMSYPDATALLK